MKKILLLLVIAGAAAFVVIKRKQAAAAEQELWDEATGAVPKAELSSIGSVRAARLGIVRCALAGHDPSGITVHA